MNNDVSLFHFALVSRRFAVAVAIFGGSTVVTELVAASPEVKSGLEVMAARLGATGGDPALNEERTKAAQAVDELLAQAISRHPVLAAATARSDASAAERDAARAALQPSLRLSATGGNSRSHDLDSSASSSTDSRELGLTLRQNLYRGGRDLIAIDAANAGVAIAAAERASQTLALTFELRRAASQFNYAVLQHLLAKEAEADAVKLRLMSERKFGAGQVGRIDVHSATMREKDARARTMKAAIAEHDAWSAVLAATGEDAATLASITTIAAALTKVALPIPKTAPDWTRPVEPSLESQKALATRDKANAQAQSARRARWAPEVDITASVARRFTDGVRSGDDVPSSSTTDKQQTLNLGLELSWPLWAAPQSEQARAAQFELAATEALAKQAKLKAALAVDTLRTRLNDLYGALPIYQEAWEEAGRLYDAQLSLYEAGAIDVLAVTDADARRLEALSTWHGAINEIRTSLLRWDALAAGLITAKGD